MVGVVDAPAPEVVDEVAPGSDMGWVMGALAALAGLLVGLAPIHDNSFLTHLATGRLILDQGRVPTVDPYSFTAAGEPWVVQSWLASVIYGVVDTVAGLAGLRVLHGLLCAAIAVGLWHLTARSRSLAVRGGVTLAALVVASDMLPGRPLLFGLLGLVLVLLAADGRIDPRWLVPVMWVWVNTHGSFPFAVLLVGLLAVGHRMDEGRWGPEVRVGLWTLAGIALASVNPLGLRLLLYPTLLARRTEAFRSVAEWKPPDYSHWFQIGVVGLTLLTAALVVARRRRWRDALPLLVFAGLGVTSARNLVVLLVVLVPILAGAAPEAGPAVADVRRASLRPARAIVTAFLVVFTVVSLQQPDAALGAYPEEAGAWMEEEGMWGPESRVVAPDYVGNWREAAAGTDARVFIDDRVDMYPIELVRDYLVLIRAEEGWEDVLAEHEATAVLWDEESDLGEALLESPDWIPVHRSAPWVVFAPASSH